MTALAACACSRTAAGDGRPAAAPPAPGSWRLRPHYDQTGRLQTLEYDRDGNGTIDTWGYMDGTRVVRVETDENGDGTVDRWEFHRDPPAGDPSPASAAGLDTVERIERATRRNGVVSRREYFTAGVLTRIEEDTDGDGRLDKWETYADGSLSLLAIDTRKRGTADRRLVYRPDGSLDHIEADPNGTGTFRTLTP